MSADETLLRQLSAYLDRAVDAGMQEPATRFAAVEQGRQESDGSAPRSGFPRPPTDKTAILDLAGRFRDGATTPVAAVREVLSAAHAAGDQFNAFLLVLDDQAVEDAGEADRRFAADAPRSPLEGVPIAVKDVIDLEGHPTTGGSAIPGSVKAEADGECVCRLKEAGAVIVGKTALHEWAYGVTSDNPFFGTVRNPVDPDRIPGGSSGGSAVAVAAGAVPAALGSDTGGSVRIPAAACGVVGFKPTYDLISRGGSVPQAWSLDHIGTLATSVTDAWLVAEAAAHGAQGDFGAGGDSAARSPAGSLEGYTLGVLAGWENYASETVWRRHRERLSLLRAAGATLKDFIYPDAETAWAAWLTILIAESATYHAAHLAERAGDISADVRIFLETGACVSAQDYLRAQQIRRSWRARTIEAMADIDAVVCPTLPDVAPEIGTGTLHLRQGDVALRDGFVHYQWPANLAGAPSISLPGAASRGALPIGLMMTGKTGEDRALVELSLCVERCLGGEA